MAAQNVIEIFFFKSLNMWNKFLHQFLNVCDINSGEESALSWSLPVPLKGGVLFGTFKILKKEPRDIIINGFLK